MEKGKAKMEILIADDVNLIAVLKTLDLIDLDCIVKRHSSHENHTFCIELPEFASQIVIELW